MSAFAGKRKGKSGKRGDHWAELQMDNVKITLISEKGKSDATISKLRKMEYGDTTPHSQRENSENEAIK